MSIGHAVHLQVTLETATPDSVRLIGIPGWTGSALMCSRSQYQHLAVHEREEFRRPGAYVLTGPGDTHDPRPRLYVGHTDAAGRRLDHHLAGKTGKAFWTDLVLFTAAGGSLNGAHFRHIEQRLHGLAAEQGRVRLENVQRPGGAQLGPHDRGIAEHFLGQMLLIFPLRGVSAFIPRDVTPPPPPPPPSETWRMTSAGCDATAVRSDGAFRVLSGSVGRAQPGGRGQPAITSRRQALINAGTLRVEGDQLILTQDHDFRTSSGAAAMLAGVAMNGRRAWKNAAGQTIEQVEDAAGKESDD